MIGWTNLFRLFIKTYKPAAISGMILYAVLVVGFFFLLRLLYKKKLPIHIVARILSLTFTGLVLFNVALACIAPGKPSPDDGQVAAVSAVAPTSSARTMPAPSDETTSAEITPDLTSAPFGLPNVYVFILDEYGTFDIMSKYYDYDNQVFYDFLKMEGFNVSRESYGTDNQTEHCFCDLLNLDYISRHYSKDECYDVVPDAELFRVFSDLGYSQFQTSNSKYFKGIVSLNSEAGQAAYDDINMFGDEGAGEIASGGSISDAFSELLGSEGTGSDTEVDADSLNEWGFLSLGVHPQYRCV